MLERIVLVAVGEVELEWLESIHDALPVILGRRCRIDPRGFDPGRPGGFAQQSLSRQSRG